MRHEFSNWEQQSDSKQWPSDACFFCPVAKSELKKSPNVCEISDTYLLISGHVVPLVVLFMKDDILNKTWIKKKPVLCLRNSVTYWYIVQFSDEE